MRHAYRLVGQKAQLLPSDELTKLGNVPCEYIS